MLVLENLLTFSIFRYYTIEDMSIPKTDHMYRPGKLSVGISGGSTNDPDTKQINDSLIRQHFYLAVNNSGIASNEKTFA